jgi:pyruvate dehydrogenase E1 component alpha subunit
MCLSKPSIQQLIDFETNVALLYEQGKIKAPIHLRNGNEQQLINIFENIKQKDYVFSTWGSHLHALLKGVPANDVLDKILQGQSITLCFPDYNFYTSAIVGGIAPIATGVAYDIKQHNSNQYVYVFIGDMAAMTGIVHESIRYAEGWDLPITFIIEDNNKSVGTPTSMTWGTSSAKNIYKKSRKVYYYKYKLDYPHAGIGKFIEF